MNSYRYVQRGGCTGPVICLITLFLLGLGYVIADIGLPLVQGEERTLGSVIFLTVLIALGILHPAVTCYGFVLAFNEKLLYEELREAEECINV